MAEVGFEPTPPERLEPKSSALDHSATLPCSHVYRSAVMLERSYDVHCNREVSKHFTLHMGRLLMHRQS